ncbi:hypothetical protein BDL97_16G090600 [Sphagnum fallax]|nr:hypothetical protein BDL97_16G090600 [Sphagnum fallax]
MAFADNGEDELDYEDDELLETGGLRGGERGGTAAIAGLMEEEDLEDEEYEDLYGDVNVGMFSTTPHSPSHHPLQSGRGGPAVYGDADSGGDEEEEYPTIGDTEELQGFGAPKEGTLKAQPRQAEAFHAVGGDPQLGSQADGMENFYGEQEVVVAGPSDVKSKLEHGMELGVLSGQPGKPTSLKDRVGKSMPIAGGGLNGISGSEAAGIGRTTAWVPSTAGPSVGGNGGGAVNSNVASEYIAKHTGQAAESGGMMLFVGELQWWTTDAELEAALSEYGRVKNLKFFEEKASGKSKGYCQVEFYDALGARMCKEKMDGRVFNGRACVVAFASPQSIKQMGAAQTGKNQASVQGPGQAGQGKKVEGGGRGAAAAGPGGDGGRGYGNKQGRGQGGMDRGRGNQGPGRGRARGGIAPFGPPGNSMGGPPGGMMPPQGMMGPGFDPGFGPPMGRGGYGMGPGGGGGFGPRGPPFTGIGPPFPPMGPGLPGVPAHVNPAFFGRPNGNGPGMGPGGGMEGPPVGWGEVGMPGWGGEEHARHMREGVYADEMNEFGYAGELGGRVGPVRERERGPAESEWAAAAAAERRRRDERVGDRDPEWERERHRLGEREALREPRERDREKDKEWERGERVAPRVPRDKEDERPRTREDDHGKRRRMVADRKFER